MWYLKVVLILISLMANDVEHCVMCLLVICLFSLENGLLMSPTIIDWVFCFFGVEFDKS